MTPLIPEGAAGDVNINTPRLSVTNGGLVSVRNDGLGNAGTVKVNANFINLDNQGGITASTASGVGGNVFLNVANQLKLDHNSIISTNTKGGEGGNISVSARDFRLQRGSSIDASALGGTKKGGNIALNTDTLEMFDSSTIKANAFGGPGGNIQINTQGLFQSPDSVISASSRYGINGTVRINTPYIDFTRASANPVTPPQAPQVSSVCSSRAGSTTGKVVNAGTGGTPPSSEDALSSNTGWHDNSMTPQSDENVRKQAPTIDKKPLQFVQAQGWIRRPNGVVSLVAEPPGTPLSKLSSSLCYQQAQTNTAENK